MTEFSTSALLKVEVDQGSLRQAREDISSALGDVAAGVDAGGSTLSQSMGATAGGSAAGGALAFDGGSLVDLAGERNDVLEDIEDNIGAVGGGGMTGGFLGFTGGSLTQMLGTVSLSGLVTRVSLSSLIKRVPAFATLVTAASLSDDLVRGTLGPQDLVGSAIKLGDIMTLGLSPGDLFSGTVGVATLIGGSIQIGSYISGTLGIGSILGGTLGGSALAGYFGSTSIGGLLSSVGVGSLLSSVGVGTLLNPITATAGITLAGLLGSVYLSELIVDNIDVDDYIADQQTASERMEAITGGVASGVGGVEPSEVSPTGTPLVGTAGWWHDMNPPSVQEMTPEQNVPDTPGVANPPSGYSSWEEYSNHVDSVTSSGGSGGGSGSRTNRAKENKQHVRPTTVNVENNIEANLDIRNIRELKRLIENPERFLNDRIAPRGGRAP